MVWQRPPSVPYPSVWGRCEGKKPMSDGRVPRFRIQDAPEEMFQEVVDHMATVFLTGELLSANRKVVEDPVSVAEAKDLWRAALKDKLCLVAIVELPDGTEKLAGVNLTCISVVEDKDKIQEFQGPPLQKVLGLIQHMTQTVNIFELYGVDAYMAAFGLSVCPAYQGQGLGLAILKARVPLCKATGIKVTGTVFVPPNAQEIARRAGFKLLAEKDYKDFTTPDGKEMFPGLDISKCMNMALIIE